MKSLLLFAVALSYTLSLSAKAELIGYWSLDGDFDDASGKGNDGVLFGGASYQADFPAELGSGMSVAFDGLAGTYGVINPGTGMAITTLPEFTVSMWVKGDGLANSDDRVFSEGMTTDTNPLFNVGTHNASADGTVDVYIRNGAAAQTFGHAHSPGIAFDGSWHHIVFSGGSDKLLDVYIDGVFDVQFDHSSVPDFTPDTTTIGGILRATDCCNFLGSIDDVAFWDQELLPADIAALADGSVSPADLIPLPTDADMDGMRDTYEQVIIDADPDDAIETIEDVLPDDDFDLDTASNIDEEANRTDPTDPDSDDDGANDGSETNTGIWVGVTDRGTDPLDDDSDDDQLLDGVENPDLPYVGAMQPGTDPNNRDTDGDSIGDGAEIAAGTDPTDANDPGSLLPTLSIDFNSTTQDGGPHPQGLPYLDYNAGHEVAADFTTQSFNAFGTVVALTPTWPDSTDNRVQQMIDRGAGNDNQWLGTGVNLLTDWLGTDTRTGNGGNGNYDGVTGTPTTLLLTLAGVPGGTYEWISYHHDTENIHTPFLMDISRDGGLSFEPVGRFQMTSSSTGGNPANPAIETGPDPQSLSSTVRHTFATDGTAEIVLRFIPLSQGAVHQQLFGINGFDLVRTSSNFDKFAITSIVHNLDDDMITLTWPSTPGQIFSIDTSPDLQDWPGDIDDGYPAAEDAEETSITFPANSLTTARIFFRVRLIPN